MNFFILLQLLVEITALSLRNHRFDLFLAHHDSKMSHLRSGSIEKSRQISRGHRSTKSRKNENLQRMVRNLCSPQACLKCSHPGVFETGPVIIQKYCKTILSTLSCCNSVLKVRSGF